VLTAAITAAIGWILLQFGIKPGPYLVVVAGVVKGIIILAGVLLGAKAVQKRVKAKEAKEAKEAAAAASSDASRQEPAAPGPTEKT
jgi:hypothetical protein